MPLIKSAKKRVKVAKAATKRNQQTKRVVRQSLKAYDLAAKSGKKLAEAHAAAQSALDTAAKKGLMHKNKLARKKRQLAKMAKIPAGAKKAVKTVKKTAPTVKKVTKKVITKKTTPKKPAKTAKSKK